MPEGLNRIPREGAEGAESLEALRAENTRLKAELAVEREKRAVAERRLEASGLDELTGLPLRGPFKRAANIFFAHAEHEGERRRTEHLPPQLSALFIDIDHFKQVNDSYGHPKADEVLRAVADALSGGIRPTDLIGRWGGEEIIILLPGATEEQAAERAETLRQKIVALSFEAARGPFSVTASIGVATLENDGMATLEALAERADEAMYAAKQEGRNRVVTATVLAERKSSGPRQGEFSFE